MLLKDKCMCLRTSENCKSLILQDKCNIENFCPLRNRPQHEQAFSKECVTENYFLYFSSKTYVVGTQKNRLNETVLLSTKTYAKTDG